MAGQLIPVVLMPRFTCLSGADTFRTIAMDVTPYSSGLLSVWRSPLLGSSPTFAFLFEESSDQVTWTACTISPSETDPGADDETQYTVTLKKRWLRVAITLGGGSPVATLWIAGFLEERET